jgi:RNase P subunit RPR2
MTGHVRVGVREALYLADRPLLAMTCRLCGELKPGTAFNRRYCAGGTYVNRRCRPCSWRHAESSPGRNGAYR